MKKIVFIVILSLIAIVGAIYFDFASPPKIDDEESRTYDTGYEDGKSSGYGIGYDEGYSAGYDDGYDKGLDNGCDDGYEIGYRDGESDGYYSGATYACIFYGDVDRAFQTATNGKAWFDFVNAYDQYVSNIFDDNEKRFDLAMSLLSATEGYNMTEDEIELLISSFGEDLFIRNGVNLTERS